MFNEIFRNQWYPLRSNVVADDTALITTFEHDNAIYLANKFELSKDIGSIVITFWGKDTDNDTGSYKLFGRATTNGPIEAIAAGNIIAGSQLITNEPILNTVEVAYWVDSITNTVEWVKNPVIKNNGNDGICYLNVDAKRLKDVYLEFTNIGGTAPEMTEVNAIITGMVNA